MAPRTNWKAIAWLSIGLAVFFMVTAAGQYFFVQARILSSVQKQLQTDANEVADSVIKVVSPSGKPDFADYNKVWLTANNYVVLSNDGVVLNAVTSNKDNLLPPFISGVADLPRQYFNQPSAYFAPTGERWVLFAKRFGGAYVAVGMSGNSELVRGETPEETLIRDIGYFSANGMKVSVDSNQIDNPVDYAIVSDGTLQAASGRLPLKANLAAVNESINETARGAAIVPLQEDIVSPAAGRIGIAIVWTDLTREQAVLASELWFVIGFGILSWLIALVLALRYWSRAETDKRELRQAFQNYLSPQVMEAILRDPKRVKLGGQRREVTILFSDIRSFTSLTEKLPPQQLTHLLQEYFDAMTEEVIATEGVVDKYIGDAIMAFWGAPIDQADQADRAVRTAISMVNRLKELQKKWSEEGYPVLDVGIGINLGVATVGNFGSRQRFDYTLIGDAVNAASRIEGLNKQFGSRIIISESTLRQLTAKVQTKDLGTVHVKGKEETIRVFEVLV